MTEPLTPAEVFHPADFVEDELEARGWSWERLAVEMGGDFEKNLCTLEFLQLRDSRLRMGDLAADLGRAFGTSAEFWTNLEASWLRQTNKN